MVKMKCYGKNVTFVYANRSVTLFFVGWTKKRRTSKNQFRISNFMKVFS